ncbi:MAG: F0F1 ATP synthase subunit C [Lactobacillaceae bacterium]|jgi:F-type H+-transporting ATPase subunit c|nr:F0F1 ATP synthase subunit C [Lactobacillaceae bacterium]
MENLIGAGVALMGAAIGGGVGNGILMSKLIESIARQPELEGRLRTNMFLSMALVEAMPIIVVAMSFVLINSK